MKKIIFGKQLPCLLMTMCVLAAANINAENAIVNKTDLKDDCSKDLLLAYFPEAFVKETFKKFNVPKDKWDIIIKALNAKDKDVAKLVEEKASKLDPNPLKDPQQRQAAVKLFRSTLLEVFSSILKANGVTDDKQISSMLDDIQQQKAKRFAECLKKDSDKLLNDVDELEDDDDLDDSDDDDLDDEDDVKAEDKKKNDTKTPAETLKASNPV